MHNPMRIALEIGPKGKRVVAVAPDWPGLERGAKDEELACERLTSYFKRYAPVARLAGLQEEFMAHSGLEVVERYPGVGSTDFWGISFSFSSLDQQPVTAETLERELCLLRACWAFFDQVRSSVSVELQRGPRGGGRDRDQIVRHTLAAELDFAKKVALKTDFAEIQTQLGLLAHRDAFCKAIESYHAERKMARTWPLRYLIRHTAYHTLDHAWEMEDKDLSHTPE